MLPEIRQNDFQYDVPAFDIVKNDIEGFSEELIGFQEYFSDCFRRKELKGHFKKYMAGQLSQLERKSIEPIALSIEGANVRSMQRFISKAEWDDDLIEYKYRNLVNGDMGHPDGALIFDESSFVKKGNDSAGVARQYAGSIGKVENCQVGVFAAYTSPYGYALIDKRLYIPEKWFGDDFEDRREKCGISENIKFKTKPQLAVDMLNGIFDEGILPFKYILADSVYGENADFMTAVDGLTGKIYLVSIGSDSLCWLQGPGTIKKTYTYRGKVKSKTVLKADEKSPITVKTFAENLNNFFWYRRKVSEGTKGPITYEFTKREVVLSNNGLPSKTVWLIIRRSLDEKGEFSYSFFISNAPASSRLPLFTWLAGLRWSIEQCFQETKSELGMDHYEVRKYKGWHHHILICMLAHFFLWHLKIRLEKKSTYHYSIATKNID